MLRYKLIIKKWAPYIVAGLVVVDFILALYAIITPSPRAENIQDAACYEGAPVCNCYDVAPDLVKCDCAQDISK